MPISIEELYSVYLNHRAISTDSRQIIPGSLFFALKGDNFDGNKYAGIALDAGAAFAVIDNEAYSGNKTLLVNDTLDALQKLALMHRRKLNIPVVAITGSNGKTTTKELINAVLSQQYSVTATKGNLNNHIGVPLTLLDITEKTQIAIVEMGANHQLEIAQLCQLAEPTHGLITNIGKAHLGGFGGYDGVIKAKNELYYWLRNSAGTVFVNSGNPLLMELTSRMKRILYGKEEGIQTRGEARKNTSTLELDWLFENEIITIKTNLVGNYNFENVMAAICLGTFFDVPKDKIKAAISSYQPSNSRSQAMKTAKNSIILDAYNANPTSMQLAIENFRQVNAPHKMVILGDMLELGDESPAEHLAIVNLVSESGFERVVFVGPDFKSVAIDKFQCFDNSDKALEWLRQENIKDFTILVKGSRGIKMEKVLEVL
ncbi:MAG: UDP-N-acetylmuramoyl-tripeptide--D-alanyl-D-alanine ligase [Bacteroidales bacterium]|nr:UDP-N-acetylmuramoyl-tripeptide--D-alanyl-D-alanine ligase [Bacteroidales bacterium]